MLRQSEELLWEGSQSIVAIACQFLGHSATCRTHYELLWYGVRKGFEQSVLGFHAAPSSLQAPAQNTDDWDLSLLRPKIWLRLLFLVGSAP